MTFMVEISEPAKSWAGAQNGWQHTSSLPQSRPLDTVQRWELGDDAVPRADGSQLRADGCR